MPIVAGVEGLEFGWRHAILGRFVQVPPAAHSEPKHVLALGEPGGREFLRASCDQDEPHTSTLIGSANGMVAALVQDLSDPLGPLLSTSDGQIGLINGHGDGAVGARPLAQRVDGVVMTSIGIARCDKLGAEAEAAGRDGELADRVPEPDGPDDAPMHIPDRQAPTEKRTQECAFPRPAGAQNGDAFSEDMRAHFPVPSSAGGRSVSGRYGTGSQSRAFSTVPPTHARNSAVDSNRGSTRVTTSQASNTSN